MYKRALFLIVVIIFITANTFASAAVKEELGFKIDINNSNEVLNIVLKK
ncbi:hypothetical protein [Thermoanaerobacter mathranii]